jgi:hypothetical protein
MDQMEEILEQVKEMLDGLEGEEREAFCRQLAALAEGFADEESWAEAQQADRSEKEELAARSEEMEQEIARLQAEEEELQLMKKAAAAEIFVRAGALDGEYLVEKMSERIIFSGGKPVQPEEMVLEARKEYPALFLRQLSGVRPAEVREVREPVRELSFHERARMFAEQPGEYRRMRGV